MVILLQISFLLFNIPFQGERQYGISRIAHGRKSPFPLRKNCFPGGTLMPQPASLEQATQGNSACCPAAGGSAHAKLDKNRVSAHNPLPFTLFPGP